MQEQLAFLEKDRNFESLPKEIILHVFGYLKIVDIIKCGQVSKRLRIISKQKRRTGKAISRPVGPKKYQQGFSKFEALPNEIILNVFSYLPTEDLPKCRLISKRFRDISDVLQKSNPQICGRLDHLYHREDAATLQMCAIADFYRYFC